MKIFKSHFWYNKSQRNGILFLVVTLFLLQFFYFFVDFSSNVMIDTDSLELLTFKYKIDSLRKVALEKRKPKLFSFNPNYITDFKGYQLGMTLQEIDRLHEYRKENKFVNSIKEFQKVTEVPDSILNNISPYFKFPDWVLKRNKLLNTSKSIVVSSKPSIVGNLRGDKIKITTNNVNNATQQDFETINGLGEVLSERVIKYRQKLQGFSYNSQLYEVWGIERSTIDKVLKIFKIYQKPNIQKINVNTASFKEVLKNPYINYNLCKDIFEYKDEVAELQDISEIKNIDSFPIDKYDRIVLYLKAE